MMQSFLSQAGYISNAEADIWSRPEYCGIAYSDGDEVEQRIEQIVRSTKDLSVLSSELRSHCTDWPSLYHLSGVRANILRPFESDLNGHILEVGAGCGAISRYLGECGATVLALEGSLRRAAIARLRTRDQPNVMVVAEQFDQFLIDQKFDVITLIGVLEYANLFATVEHPALAMLEHARSLLKPNGKLIIAIENQLGLKYFAGAPEDHLGQSMYGIEGRYQMDEPQTFGRRFLSELIHQAGFAKSEFLIPFPDYKLPVCILTAEGLNAPDFDAAELACQSITKDAQLPERTLFSLERSLPVVFLNGLAVDLANSFLIVAANSSEDDLRSGSLAYYFSTDRRSDFCKETIFVRSDESILVKRRALPTNSFPEPIENAHLFFQPPCDLAYFRGKTLYQKFVAIVTRPDWSIKEIQHYFSKYLEIILEIVHSEGHLCSSQLQNILLPGDYLDAIPSNIVMTDDGKAVYIDREWCALQGISLDYLLFRAITSLMKGISTFSQPQDPALATRGGFLLAVMNSLGFSPTDEDFSRFLWMESELGIFASGVESRVFTTWSPDASLPGCSGSFPGEALESRLKRTELAKSVAEKFAYERLAEIQRLQTQLVATEEAKDYAESLAIDRLQELQQLQGQLTQTRAQLEFIQSSRGYKLLKIIRLDPNRRRPDV
ncbi:bifunctional 2-polyprenyl-6-hydroxyphenol methylase/3-demethylubiquinol 3-O-methyltransferase UbiG [uncultured Nitrosomonas sp.]|uniref:class I SAM-dependent methyltransferase n=1 Tax=uncultured Nitrosomonas sp. TaxID=156424 RepID=UPI0025F1A5B3|nr:class I SAM-dependent methyltransferase [uncultured Nitrosomonas sp.]